jgi:pilus assembly protein CpaB
MLDRRLAIVLGVALVVAMGSGLAVLQLLQAAQAEARPSTITVLVASASFPEGHRLSADDVEPREMPVAAVPADVFTTVDSIVGRVTRVPVFRGETLVLGRLAPSGSGAGLEVRITPGKRAMAVRIDDVAGLAGLVQPDSRVDVVVTVGDGIDAPPHSRVIMHNMRVLSVGAETERASASSSDAGPVTQAAALASTATLEVTPSEAEQLALATNQGRIQLVLRGFGDPETVITPGASIGDMLPEFAAALKAQRTASMPSYAAPALPAMPTLPTLGSAPVAASSAAPRADSTIVRVFRGDQTTEQRFARRDSTDGVR